MCLFGSDSQASRLPRGHKQHSQRYIVCNRSMCVSVAARIIQMTGQDDLVQGQQVASLAKAQSAHLLSLAVNALPVDVAQGSGHYDKLRSYLGVQPARSMTQQQGVVSTNCKDVRSRTPGKSSNTRHERATLMKQPA